MLIVHFKTLNGIKLVMLICRHELFFFFILAVIVGGVDQMSQALVLAKKPHIIVGE